MRFAYKIHMPSGSLDEGFVEAADSAVALSLLKAKGGTVLFIGEEKAGLPWLKKLASSSFFGKVKLHEKIMFTRNLAGMIKAGLALSRAVEVLSKQTKNPLMKKILASILADISKGSTLSGGIQKFPKVFSPLFVSMVRAGEESGTLADSLMQIGGSLEKIYNLNKKVKGALMYPSIIVGAIILIGILMLIYVVPTLTKTFTELGIDLPASTKFIIGLSDFVGNNTLAFLGTIAAFMALVWYGLRRPRVARAFDFVLLRLPVIGTIAQETNSARATRTLASLLSSGVSMTRALEITKEVVGNAYYKEAVERAAVNIEKGGTLSEVFKANTKIFPVMVGEMIEVGEETGNLASMLTDIAVFYEGEVDTKLKDLSTIIEPVLMVLIGGAVGFFAISMISPMYSLMDTIE